MTNAKWALVKLEIDALRVRCGDLLRDDERGAVQVHAGNAAHNLERASYALELLLNHFTREQIGDHMSFKLDQDASHAGTHLVGEVFVAPATLRAVFGEPKEADGYKVSGEYIFEGINGEVFTVYDWKVTTLYDTYEDDPAPTPAEFWASQVAHPFHIGGCSDPEKFKAWIERKVAGAP
jgi:hypothetical protein